MAFVNSLLIMIGIYIAVSLLWAGAEKLIYKEVTPRGIDDTVAYILTISLYYNFN